MHPGNEDVLTCRGCGQKDDSALGMAGSPAVATAAADMAGAGWAVARGGWGKLEAEARGRAGCSKEGGAPGVALCALRS